jgi:hypothetical protein
MTFDEFLILYQDAPIIASSTFELACDDAAQLRVQVRHWQSSDTVPPSRWDIAALREGSWRTPARTYMPSGW